MKPIRPIHFEIQTHRANPVGLLRSSFRQGGKIKHTNHGRITGLALDQLKLLQAAFRGDVVPKGSPQAFQTLNSREYGASHALLQLAKELALDRALYSRNEPWVQDCLAMIVGRVVYAGSKLALSHQWKNTALWELCGVPGPVDRQEWYWNFQADWWAGPPAVTVAYLTRAFEESETVFQVFDDGQLKQGVWYLVSNSCSDHMFALLDAGVPWPARQRCIRSFLRLYEQCFARRCTPHLSHLDEPGASPLNRVCYMWWDIIPIYGQPQDPGRKVMDQEILEVLASTLELESIACQESALHGLGHWQIYYPAQVRKIVRNFVQKHPAIREDLRLYACKARRHH